MQAYGLMLVATIITISIVTASQLITQRISLLLDRQASELLAADLVVKSTAPLHQRYRLQAQQLGLSVAAITSLRTAIFIGGEPQLVELKAVSENYPLRGQLEIARDLTAERQPVRQIPARGDVWVDAKLQQTLNTPLTIGRQAFDSRLLLTYEPDRGGTLFNLAPRVLMNLDDLVQTDLIVPGSRVSYRLLFAGDADQVSAFSDWLTTQLAEGEEIQDLQNARPEMRQALEQTRKFFALSVMLTLVIAMVAIAITAGYSAARETTKVAMLRAFGISRARLSGFYLWQLLRLWLLACVPGMWIGWIMQYPLEWVLDDWFGLDWPSLYTWQPYLLAGLVGFISLLGFSLPHLLNVIATPPMQVFRPLITRYSSRRGLYFTASALITLFLILVLLLQSSTLAVTVLVMILLLALSFPVIFLLLIKTLQLFGARRFWLRGYLLSRLRSRDRGSILVMTGFSLALLAILLIAVVKDELLAAWQTQLPEDIPNYFLVNLQKQDVPTIQMFLEQQGIVSSDPYPLVRTRLHAINQIPVESIKFTHPRAQNLINHNFNVSYAGALPADNDIIQGHWMAAGARDQFSVEQSMAERLGLQLGDVIMLTIAGEQLEAPVTSIRSVLWENFKPNFYLMSNRQLIEQKPQTWLLSALIEAGHKPVLKQLLARYPTITLLDISALISRIRAIIERASTALEFFFLFALASCFVVLLAAIQTGKRERQMESALLRALAAPGAGLYRVHILEFTLMGLLVGFFAALFANLAGWWVSVEFFNIDYHFSILTWIYSLVSSMVVLTLAGIFVSRKVYRQSPMKLLRT